MPNGFTCRLRRAGFLLLTLLLPMADSISVEKYDLSRREVPALQQVINRERQRGPLYASIPIAYVFGMGGERSPKYCSPSVRIANTSNAPIDEILLGVEYRSISSGKIVASSLTRITNVKIKTQDSQFYHHLGISDCNGLEGILTVVHCKYSTGDDCTRDVLAVNFGAIPLRLKEK